MQRARWAAIGTLDTRRSPTPAADCLLKITCDAKAAADLVIMFRAWEFPLH
jgi:hypothetical protein